MFAQKLLHKKSYIHCYISLQSCRKKTLQLSFLELSLCYKLLTGGMDTALHFAADVQGGLLQGAEEERSPASDGFMVADANQLVTLEQAQQKRDAVDVLHSYVREYVQKKGSEVVVDSLPAMRASVQR